MKWHTAITRPALRNHPVIRTSDLAAASRAIAVALQPHRVLPLEKGRPYDICFNHLRLDHLGLSYLRYGGRLRVDIKAVRDFYLVQMPLVGSVRAHIGPYKAVATPERAIILGPPHPASLDLDRACAQILVVIPRAFVDDQMRRHADEETLSPLPFKTTMDLKTGAGLTWARLIATLVGDIEDETALLERPALVAPLEALIALAFVEVQSGSGFIAATGQGRRAVPYFVKRAEDYIRANRTEALRLGELVQVSGVSRASLYRGFSKFLHMGPKEFHMRLRMEGVHEALTGADPREVTVVNVASRYGFTHLGRFAAAYRKLFGEYPSETLKRRPTVARTPPRRSPAGAGRQNTMASRD